MVLTNTGLNKKKNLKTFNGHKKEVNLFLFLFVYASVICVSTYVSVLYTTHAAGVLSNYKDDLKLDYCLFLYKHPNLHR